LGKIAQSNAIKKSKTAKASLHWPHLAANPLALSGRKSGGSIWPQFAWLHLAATALALCARKFTDENKIFARMTGAGGKAAHRLSQSRTLYNLF
jgi:hypothetical protein